MEHEAEKYQQRLQAIAVRPIDDMFIFHISLYDKLNLLNNVSGLIYHLNDSST